MLRASARPQRVTAFDSRAQESDRMKEVLDDGDIQQRPMSAMRAKLQEGIQKRVSESVSSEQRVKRQQIFAAVRSRSCLYRVA